MGARQKVSSQVRTAGRWRRCAAPYSALLWAITHEVPLPQGPSQKWAHSIPGSFSSLVAAGTPQSITRAMMSYD